MNFAQLPNQAKIEWLLLEAFSGWSSHDLLTRSTNEYLEIDSDEQWQFYNSMCALSQDDLDEFLTARLQYRRQDAARKNQLKDAFLFFNKPGTLADFGFWARKLLWTVDQAVALSMGRNPDLVNSITLSEPANLSSESAFAQEYFARMRIARTFIATGQLMDEATPGEMLAWLNRAKLPTPPDLVAAVSAMNHRIADWYSEFQRVEQQLNEMREYAEQQASTSQLWERQCVELMTVHERKMSETENALRLAEQQRDELAKQIAALGEQSARSEPTMRGIDPRRYRSALIIIHGVAVGKFKFGEDSMTGRSALKNMTTAIELAGHSISQ